MNPIVSPALMGAHALPATLEETHARGGNHLRVHHHPLLGLPVAPFIVERAITNGTKGVKFRTTGFFYAADGTELIPPFAVSLGQPVTVRIPCQGAEFCIWAQLMTGRPPIIGTGPVPTGGPFDPVPPFNPTRPPRVPTGRRALARAAADEGGLLVSAYVGGATGPAFVGRRSKPRYALSGPGLVELRIQGTGIVRGLLWIEAHDVERLDYQPFTVMALPHRGGARYLGIQDPEGAAKDRVGTQAPKRRPLQDTTDAPAPASTPLFSDGEEIDRVASLSVTLDRDLDRLIDDLSTMPLDQLVSNPIIDERGTEVGTSTIRRLHRVNQLQSDPGTASHLGYKTLDDGLVEVEDRLVFYRVSGFFHDFPAKRPNPDLPVPRTGAEIVFDAMLATVPVEDRTMPRSRLLEIVTSGVGLTPGFEVDGVAADVLEDHRAYVSVGTVAVADRGAPLDPVDPPVITGLRHMDWVPAVPPAALRAVEVSVADVMVGGLLAAQKRTPPAGAGTFAAVNAQNAEGWRLPVVLSLATDPNGLPMQHPGTGFVVDRSAGPSSIRYFVAQQDRFGRFSDWAAANAGPGPRPKPPRPDVTAYYTPVPAEQAAGQGGPVLIHVPVPDVTALAPGSHPLDRVRVALRDERLGITATLEGAEAAKEAVPGRAGEFRVALATTGPILDPMERRVMRITAQWIDASGAASTLSEPFLLSLRDLRAPPQVAVPDRLQYSARPDVTGLAWVEHRWVPSAGQAQYGVYYSDENRLRAHLKAVGRQDLLNALAAAPDAAARATVLRTNQALFPDHLFEKLDGVTRDLASGEKAFRHAVSGSLRILSAYKVAAESANGIRPPLSGLPIILYGVPNADPPPRPVLSVRPVDPEGSEPPFVVAVTIRLSPGATAGQSWRLRRTATSSSNALMLPVVTTGAFPAVGASGEQVARVRDAGPLVIAPDARLKPWVRYAWVAEAQGAPESGSVAAGTPVPGLWSSASDPVTLILVPPGAPVAPSIDGVEGTPAAGGLTDVTLSLSHPGPLAGGEMGSYVLRLARRLPGGVLTVLSESTPPPNGTVVLAGSTTGEVVPEGTVYVAVLVDPIGRSSPSATATVELVE